MHRLRRFLFKNSTTRQTVLKNTFWIGASATFIKILRAVIIIYAARLLGTGGYGVFTYAMSIAAIFAVVSDMGLTSIITRELSKNVDRALEYFSTAFFVKLGFLLTAGILIVGIGPLLSRYAVSSSLMPVIALSLIFESLRTFLYAIPRAENKMQTEAAVTILNELLCTAVIVVMFLKNPTPMSLALSFMIGNGIGLLASFVIARRYVFSVTKYFAKKLFFPIIGYTLPFAILGVFGILMTNIDSLILGYFGNEQLLGLFGAAMRPIGILYMLPNFLTSSLLPVMSRFQQENRKETINSIINTAAIAAITIALPLTVGGIIVAKPLINVVFGYDYIAAVRTFQLLLGTLLFVFPGTIFADILLIENRQRFFLVTSAVGATINIGLDMLLIPTHGIAGSAVATLAAQAAVNVLFYAAVRKRHTVHIFRRLYKSVIAVFIMGVAAYELMQQMLPLILIIIISAAIYAGLLYAFRDQLILELRRTLRRS